MFGLKIYLRGMVGKGGFNGSVLWNTRTLLAVATLWAQNLCAQTAPTFTSTPVISGTYQSVYNYSITTTDPQAEAVQILLSSGTLPGGLTLVDNNDGTASLNGTPTATGDFPIILTVQETGDPGEASTQPFTISIAKAVGSVVLSNMNQTYTGAALAATATTSPGTYPVNITYDGSGTAPVNAGTYSVVATINDPNFSGTTSGTFTIAKAPLVATADNQTKVYGQPNPVFTISYSGFLGSDNAASITAPDVSSASNSSAVGGYAITLSNGSAANYSLSLVNGTLTVTPATLTAKADNVTKIYGQTNPALTISYSGFVNSDDATSIAPPMASTTATGSSSVGSYPITLSGGSAANYTLVLQNGTLAITPAPLVAKADDQTRPYGVANPVFTITYTGFILGDNVSSITPPSASTAATTLSNAGTYPIIVSGGSAINYSLSPQSGTLTITKVTPVVSWNTPSPIVFGTALSSAQLDATASVSGSFNYSPGAGITLNAGVQTLSVSFTPTDAANYTSVLMTTVQLMVNKATPVITWPNPAAIVYGTPLSSAQLNASSNVTGSFLYSPAAGVVLNAGASQSLTATFTPSDAANYNAVSGITAMISVLQAAPVVTWSNPATISYGTALSSAQLNATANVAGSFSYAPGAGTILNVGPNQALSVNFTPSNANYASVNGTQVVITVIKSTPIITWSNPGPITYGTPLSATQLNATSLVAGTFAYSPDFGTVLSAGLQTLNVTFTPNDLANYNTGGTASVQITVNKATPVITWPTPAAITYNAALTATQLNATSSAIGGGSFVYSPAIGTTLNAGNGQVLSVAFTPANASNYISTNATVLINVSKGTPVITWSNPANISYGTKLSSTQLNATSNVPGTFTYTPDVGTTLNAGANQNLAASFTPADAANYNSVTGITRQITVLKAAPPITWAPPLPIKVGVALSSAQLDATSTVPGTFTYNPPAGTVLPAGNNQTLSVDFVPTDQANYASVLNTTVTITVSVKDNPVITWGAPSTITYGTALSSAQLNASSNVAGSFTYSPALGTVLNAGKNRTLTATFVPSDGVDYNTVNTVVHLDVNKALLSATANNASRVYGSANPTFAVTYTGFVNGDAASVIDTVSTATCNATASTPVGSSFSIIPGGGGDNNYAFNYINGTLTITKATLTAKADDKSRSYGLANPAFTISYSGFVNGDNVNSITTANAVSSATTGSNVGSYPITVSGGSASNYALAYQQGTLTVNAVPLTIIADNKSKGYGQANPPLTATYNGFVNGDNASSITQPAISVSASNLSSVGSYPITVTGGAALNYVLILQNGTLTIGKASLTAKADDKVKIYGQANPANSLTYTGFINGDGPSVITPPIINGPAATASSGVGFYPITLSGGSAVNYDLVLQNGGLTINPAPLNVTIQDASRIYGLSNPTFTFTYNAADFVNGENAGSISTPSAGTVATPASSVGTYPITLSGSTPNYSFVVKTGTFTITPAPLSVKADDMVKTYGDANPSLTFQFLGFVNGDTPASSIATLPTISTPATQLSPAGNYPISVSGGASLNYAFAYVAGTLTISKATLTVAADNKIRLYGTPNPVFTVTYSNFKNGDTPSVIDVPPTVTTDATTTSPVGSYVISVGSASDNNYDFNYITGTLSIVISNAAVLQDFQKTTNEDVPLIFDYASFYTNFIGSPGDSIVSLKIISLPASGTLFLGNTQLTVNSDVPARHGVFSNFRYVPKSNFNGTDSFMWNASDGAVSSASPATVTITILPVDDAPVLSNIEVGPLSYELGDQAVAVSKSLIIDDVDNNFIYSATISVTQDFTAGDDLFLDPNAGVSATIIPTFNAATGILALKGKETKANYEKALNSIYFESPISAGSALSNKTVSFIVSDSLADSNTASRTISITKVFPELDLVNAFTPNNDGVNDYWDFINLDFYNSINIAVFDQNGERVFACASNDCKWDGKVKGKELPPGPYFYSIDLDNGKRKYKGTVTILK